MRNASLWAGPALNGLASSHLAPSCGKVLVSTDWGVTSPCAKTAATPQVTAAASSARAARFGSEGNGFFIERSPVAKA